MRLCFSYSRDVSRDAVVRQVTKLCGEAGMLPVVVLQREIAASNDVRAKDTRFL